MLLKLWIGAASVLVLSALYILLVSDAPSYPRPWTPYAYSKEHHQLELIGKVLTIQEYESREDCMHAAIKNTASDLDYGGLLDSGYTEPYGCLYEGYENRYVQYFVNTILNGSDVQCILKYSAEDAKKYGYLYVPVLRGLPPTNGYCVL